MTRNIMVLLASILVTGSLVGGITQAVMEERAETAETGLSQTRERLARTEARLSRVEVDAFNDGFLYGACNKTTYEDGSSVWEDGNGRLCR